MNRFLFAGLLGSMLFMQDKPAELKQEGLSEFLQNLGYEVKELGEGAFEFQTTEGDLTIYVVTNISKSGQKVWMTINLGDMPEAERNDAPRLLGFLRSNAEIQPTHFFVRGDNLRIGVAMDNRGITPAMYRKQVDALAETVFKTRKLWERKSEG